MERKSMNKSTAGLVLVFALLCGFFLYIPVLIVYSIKNIHRLSSYWFNQALALDVLFARALVMKYKTISESIARYNKRTGGNWLTRLLCEALDVVDSNHCERTMH